ncbi:MAG: winged helix-turn-helix domain-containing protein [Promethearchaeota archaeon]
MSNSKKKQFDPVKLFQNDTRFQMWGLLSMYSELSFSEICKKLEKSKSTVYHHLQKLIEIGLVEVKREEKVRGSIPAKIYALRNDDSSDNAFVCGIGNKPCPSLITGEITGTIDDLLSYGIDKTISEKIIEGEKVIETYSKNIHQSRFRFYENLSSLDDATEPIKRILENKEFFNSIIFLSESQYYKVRELVEDFLTKLYEFIESNKKENSELYKPYVFLASAMNLKEILEKNISFQD